MQLNLYEISYSIDGKIQRTKIYGETPIQAVKNWWSFCLHPITPDNVRELKWK